ncbi:MAG: OmpA family protein [Desulfobacteraceae bacterium]|nr:OmpA family protein [Desulfobacteraceae bacterium]
MLAFLMLHGCAAQGTPPPAFNAQPIPSGAWQQKADYLYFILDASSSMDAAYKLDTARSVIANFNQTMPNLNLTVALRTFGHDNAVSMKSTDLMAKPQPYTAKVLPDGLARVTRAGGYSPMGLALKDAAEDLKSVTGPIAMVIVSDGLDMAEGPMAAAQALKESHAGKLCIYTVQAGDAPEGQQFLTRLAQVTGCGRATTAASLVTGAAMNGFVKEVLLAGPVAAPLDSDKDGVPDDRDKCPGTPPGIKVEDNGCPLAIGPIGTATAAGTYILEGVQFETNKADLKKSSYSALDNAAEIMKKNPSLKVEIQGHTDASGKHDYNTQLSQRRAESVKAYLETKGIEANRMIAKGYGPDRPIDTNDTKEGRARNRRVEFKPLQ